MELLRASAEAGCVEKRPNGRCAPLAGAATAASQPGRCRRLARASFSSAAGDSDELQREAQSAHQETFRQSTGEAEQEHRREGRADEHKSSECSSEGRLLRLDGLQLDVCDGRLEGSVRGEAGAGAASCVPEGGRFGRIINPVSNHYGHNLADERVD